MALMIGTEPFMAKLQNVYGGGKVCCFYTTSSLLFACAMKITEYGIVMRMVCPLPEASA